MLSQTKTAQLILKKYSTLNLFLRSCFFFLYSTSSLAIYGVFILFLFPFSLKVRHKWLRRYMAAYIFMFKWICDVDYQIEGLENIPRGRVGIVLSKHQSAWETFLLPTIFHDPAVIIKKELLWLPFFGWGLYLSGAIAIDRKDKNTAMQQLISKGKACLTSGRWIVMFPEGTRVPYGETGQYKLGGARLAVATDTFVIPVAHNAGRHWPRRKFLKQPGMIRVVIGQPIETAGRTPEEVMSLTQHWIESTSRGIDSFVHESAS